VDENTFHILDESGDLGMYMQDSANQSAKNRKDVLHISPGSEWVIVALHKVSIYITDSYILMRWWWCERKLK
jgi:hypothetical protein